MECNKENPTIAELLDRKRKLIELRDIKLTSSRKKLNEIDGKEVCPSAPFSNEQRSISPPPFSPLTPLMRRTNEYKKKTQDDPSPATPPLHTSLLRNISNDDPLSPLPIMSPATQEIYNVLITDPRLQLDDSPDIIENSDNAEENNMFHGDSDDSVHDPDFIVEKLKIRNVDDSETDCESSDHVTIEDQYHKLTPILDIKKIKTKIMTPKMNIKDNDNVKLICYEEKDIRSSIAGKCMEDNIENVNKLPVSNSKEILKKSFIEHAQNKVIRSSTCTTPQNIEKRSVAPEINIAENMRDSEYENAALNIEEIETPRMTQENRTDRNENITSTMEISSTSEGRTNNDTKQRRSRTARNASKALRNTGKSYITEKGKVVPNRKQKELSPCRLKCAERITMAEQMQCFKNYWKLGERDRRAAFVSKSVTILPKKTQITGSRITNRDCYCKYKLEISNVQKPICKECFCRILGETKGFVNVIIEKKKESPTGIVHEDQRGRQPPKNKKTIEDILLVNDHILSFPSYESHYCRKSTGKKYLAADLSIAKMYRQYKNTSSNPVSLKLYAKCFHELNLSFKQPSKDTCNTCDVLNAKIKVADEDYKINLITELAEHQHQAEKAYAEKRVDKERAKGDSSIRVFTFDLQQCLPTPYLKTSVSFYKRQLWSFNLTIHDLANNEATCYMWDETIGARGANQIASCLWHFCNGLPSEVKEVVFYSDTCGGQNKNNIVAMMFMYLLNSHPTLEIINHKFLLSGHTHMECDSDHAIIEKTKKRTQMKINHLYDWVQLVRTCKVNKPFKVVVMTLKDFLDFADLKSKKGPFSVKKLNDSGDKFLWQPIKWLQYDKSSIGKIQFKENLDCETPFQSINFKKRGKNTIELFRLSQISKESLPISAEKKKDLMDLMELIDDAFKDFYLQIKTVDDVSPSFDPDLNEDNPDLEESEKY